MSGEQMESVGCLIDSQHWNQLYLSVNHLNWDVLFCFVFPSIPPRKFHIKQVLLQDSQMPTVCSLLPLTNKLLTQFLAFLAQQPFVSSVLNATTLAQC